MKMIVHDSYCYDVSLFFLYIIDDNKLFKYFISYYGYNFKRNLIIEYFFFLTSYLMESNNEKLQF